MTLEIISTNEILFKGEVEAVTLPGALGSFTVLRNHASLLAVLRRGEVVCRKAGGEELSVGIKGGIADVDNNVVAVCVY